jgi:hypothetical protein
MEKLIETEPPTRLGISRLRDKYGVGGRVWETCTRDLVEDLKSQLKVKIPRKCAHNRLDNL